MNEKPNLLSMAASVDMADALTALQNGCVTLTFRGVYIYDGTGDICAMALAKTLEDNKTCTHLDLGSNEIGVGGAKVLATALTVNNTLTNLNLSENRTGDDGAVALIEALETNQSVITLDLTNTKITDAGVERLASIIGNAKCLRNLILSSNYITCVGATVLAQMLETNTTLTYLSLANTQIRNGGAKALAKALATNKTLATLCLTYTPAIDDETVVMLLKVPQLPCRQRPTYVHGSTDESTRVVCPISFLDVCCYRFVKTAEVLVEQKRITANDRLCSGETFLMCAAQDGHLQLTDIALRIPGTSQEDKHVAMLYAAAGGHVECLELIARR